MTARVLYALLLTLLLFGQLIGCERQDATSHREAVKVIEDASQALANNAALGENASAEWNRLASQLRGLRDGGKGLKATRDRLLCQVQWRLADLSWQDGLNSRTEATQQASTTQALLAALESRMAHLQGTDLLLNQTGAEALIGRRKTQQEMQLQLEAHAIQAAIPLQSLLEANQTAAAEVLELRQVADAKRREADQIDSIAAQPLLAEAAEIEHAAAIIEAEMARREALIRLQHQPIVEQRALAAEQTSAEVDAVTDEIDRRIQTDEALRDLSDRSRSDTGVLVSSLAETAGSLIKSLTGPLEENFEATMGHLQDAAKAAESAMRSGNRQDRDADQLAALRAQMAILVVANSRRNRLESTLDTLSRVS